MAQATAPLPAPDLDLDLGVHADLDFTDALMEERSRRIESITGEVLEVAGVFADIRALVAGHGEALEVVETRVDEAAARMKEGVAHVREAERIEAEGAGCLIM